MDFLKLNELCIPGLNSFGHGAYPLKFCLILSVSISLRKFSQVILFCNFCMLFLSDFETNIKC